MPEIKERPILFSAPMVRAILAGQKTVTRRVTKVQPRSKADIGSYGLGQPFIRNPDVTRQNPGCPYGRPGDRLWVRETFNTSSDCRPPIDEPFIYAADLNSDGVQKWAARWKPSIHMPRAASRILLEITSVSVERLQAITAEQALDEGVGDHRPTCDRPVEPDGYPACSCGSVGYIDAFADLWNSINGAGTWDANPWVWVVEFKRVMPCPS